MCRFDAIRGEIRDDLTHFVLQLIVLSYCVLTATESIE